MTTEELSEMFETEAYAQVIKSREYKSLRNSRDLGLIDYMEFAHKFKILLSNYIILIAQKYNKS